MNIINAEKLTAIFGRWPSFHDAHLKSVVIEESGQRSVSVLLHVFQMTSAVDAQGFYVLQNHVLATLKFRGIKDLVTQRTEFETTLFALTNNEVSIDENKTFFEVDFEDAIGDGFILQFKCHEVDVVEVISCDPEGSFL